jgi:hypothetical protein
LTKRARGVSGSLEGTKRSESVPTHRTNEAPSASGGRKTLGDHASLSFDDERARASAPLGYSTQMDSNTAAAVVLTTAAAVTATAVSAAAVAATAVAATSVRTAVSKID